MFITKIKCCVYLPYVVSALIQLKYMGIFTKALEVDI